MNVRIIVDSGCDNIAEMYQIGSTKVEVVPLTLQLGNKIFIDDESLDFDNYLAEMRACKTAAKTASPSPQAFFEKYHGDEGIFVVTLSSNLSSTYESAMTAKKMFVEDVGKKFIHVFDSLSASVAESLIVKKILDCVNQGYEPEAITRIVSDYIDNMKTYFILEKLDNLVKNGRVNTYVAKLSSLLNFKLICGNTHEGKIRAIEKARGWKKALVKLMDTISSECENYEEKTFGITHINCLDRALELKAEILQRFNFKEVIITDKPNGLVATYADEFGIVVAL